MRLVPRGPVLHALAAPACAAEPSRRPPIPRPLRGRDARGERVSAALRSAAAIAARIALVLAIAAGGAIGVTLLALLLSVASPLACLLLCAILWRSHRDARPALERLRARWGRAQVLAGGLGRGASTER